MVSISSVSIHRPTQLSVPAKAAAAAGKDQPVSSAGQAVEGVKVRISSEGLVASKAAGSASKTSGTAQAKQIEQLRKMMADLQKQIDEKRVQIQALAGSHLSDEQKTQQMAALNSELATLSASLTSATATLFSLMKQKPTPALSTDPVSVTAKVASSGGSAEAAPLEG
ncbi:hypothetical protein SAMN05216598_0037 [Pseudomonas asplenii]|uniref:FlxA-like protein n=1 Tax=Pseudomonas asplenii TaxID=53407 RepID=A0A1H1N826_9PSED|nr:hypothetical protein [Pseudomonas asplenii]SDR94855.1 hypothetical protein SAMN05216598_0037 [Pseudomonas asplenii]